jgi:AAA family ATP:ADP antiporter
MKAILHKLRTSVLDIRAAEMPVALLMFVYVFFVIATFAVVKPVRSSLFLEYFGARNLPYIYLATAVLAGIVSWIQTKLFARFSIVTVQALTHLFFISNLLLFWVAFRHESLWLSALFFLWVNIFTVIANSMFWIFADTYYNPREAKRLYGFINAGGTVGGIASGIAVSAAVKDFGTENMLLVCAGVLGVCILLTYLIRWVGRDRFGGSVQSYVEQSPQPANSKLDEPQGLRGLFASRYTKYIALALGLSLIISNLIDYQFNVVVEQTYASKDARTAFFGSFTAWVNGLSFILQFFLTSQLLRRLGIGATLLLLPFTLFSGSLWMGIQPGLAAAIFLKSADGSMRYSVEQSTRDILYLPLPIRIMSKLKMVVDVFIQRLAKGLGSLLILALTVWWAFGFQVLSYVAILLATAWLACAVLLRKEYRKRLVDFLTHGDLSGETRHLRRLDRTTIGDLLAAIESGDEVKGLYALHHLQGSKDRQVLAALRKLVQEGPPQLRARALWALGELSDSSVVREAEHLLHADSFETQIGAFHYLCRCRPLDLLVTVKQLLAKDDPRLPAAAIVCFASSGSPQELQMSRKMIETVLADQGANRVAMRVHLALALRHVRAPSPLHSYLRALLQDSSEEVVRAALTTAHIVLPRELVPLVVEKLTAPQLHQAALDTLRVHGDKVLGTLRDYLDDPTIPLEVRCALPQVFADVGTERAATDLLADIQQLDPRLRHCVVKALNEIRDRNPQFEFDSACLEKLLMEELKAAYHVLREEHLKASAGIQGRGEQISLRAGLGDEYDQSLERVLGLLGLMFPQRDVLTAYRGLHSSSPQLRANAIELLDTLLPPRLKTLVLALVDEEIPIEERLLIAKTALGANYQAQDGRTTEFQPGDLRIAGTARGG